MPFPHPQSGRLADNQGFGGHLTDGLCDSFTRVTAHRDASPPIYHQLLLLSRRVEPLRVDRRVLKRHDSLRADRVGPVHPRVGVVVAKAH